jgi:hypothetical protein
MEYDLSTIPIVKFHCQKGVDRKLVYHAVLQLKLLLHGENLEAELWWKDILLSKESLPY